MIMNTNNIRRPLSRHALAAALSLLLLPVAAQAGDTGSRWAPTRVFVQLGVAEHASAAVVGAVWDWSWQRDVGWGRLTGYWDISFGRWASDSADRTTSSHAWVTQLGITPVVRLYPRGPGPGWYLEGGIGANVLLPIYRTEDKRFSTSFNFGDHLALGRTFGDRGEHDVAVRFQHFSNAGIKEPNPGEDFLQLRYSHRF
ncbi:hypothetical protein ASC87_06665 [Rhizobacter sp. Root1221]|nr:hypothetical protein ASC87_06665 [Rhizobacter sp. Root1221]